MPVTIYHNPQCSKSRQTLKLLEEHGIKPQIVEYLKNPPSESELKHLLKLLGLKPRELLRKKETEYKQAKLDKPDLSDAEIVRAMVKYPRLIERPIVVVSGDVQGRTSAAIAPSGEANTARGKPGAATKAVLGRPPENVLKII